MEAGGPTQLSGRRVRRDGPSALTARLDLPAMAAITADHLHPISNLVTCVDVGDEASSRDQLIRSFESILTPIQWTTWYHAI
jgi:hypothetical protein